MKEQSHLYHLHELHHAAVAPLNMLANVAMTFLRHPFNPMSYTGYSKHAAAAAEMIERVTHRYAKPEFGIVRTKVAGKDVKIIEEVIVEKPFCRLLHFKKDFSKKNADKPQPKLLLVAPMSGHHATLLRGTVEALLPFVDVYITDWLDARDIPTSEGEFRLANYISYVIDFTKMLPNVHLMAVCQPSVPVLVAASVMNEAGDKLAPLSMTLIGGPIDTRANPTKVNIAATEKTLNWFEQNVITRVPANYAGFMRRVYPGFLQLTGFMSLNLDKHINAHKDLYKHLVQGDGESIAMHKKFYNEYLSVADLPAEFYLDCIEQVFQKQLLPRGEFVYKGKKVKPETITKTALLTLEGELDDISGVGQTEAAQLLCSSLPAKMRRHYTQKGVGHYGIFNGRKFRENVVPIIVDFIKKTENITR
jgi:poly(3-hydroxybutyrate) depolymerase